LQDDGKWVLVKETETIGEGKMFAPGNLRATYDNPEYEKLVSYWLGEKYTLRYTGGMVPDVFQIIVKEKGALLFSRFAGSVVAASALYACVSPLAAAHQRTADAELGRSVCLFAVC
jgi:fructose-1,6-bisphosphatase